MATQCDPCASLCRDTASEIASCLDNDEIPSLSWIDLGAANQNDFVDTCDNAWNRQRLDLSASDLSVALQVCRDTDGVLSTISCEEIIALYAGSQ